MSQDRPTYAQPSQQTRVDRITFAWDWGLRVLGGIIVVLIVPTIQWSRNVDASLQASRIQLDALMANNASLDMHQELTSLRQELAIMRLEISQRLSKVETKLEVNK